MSESIRPSAGEEARAAARAAENKKTKQTQNLAGQQGALQSGQANQGKKLQNSPFDELLKNASESGQASNLLPSENKFDSRLKEISHEEDRGSSSEHDKAEDDKKATDNKPEAGKKSKETGLTARERVLGKHSSGEQGSGGGGSGEKREGGSGGQKGFQKDTQTGQNFAADLRRRDPAPAPVPVEFQKIQQVDVSKIEAPEAPKELPKALLDQIVQSVTIVQKKDLSKEIQIDFHDSVFNGLRLKVTAQGKEVSVEFLVPNRTVEQTFKNERENIALALGEKGVDVRSIKVSLV